MIAIICAISSGLTIVLSRTVNGYLSQKIGPYQSTFFNYLTGLITSFIILCFNGLPYLKSTEFLNNPAMILGGFIGIFNVLILNIISPKITPVNLTLITFIAQMISSIVLDYCLFNIFTMKKLIGCLIVTLGLTMYQLSNYPNFIHYYKRDV